MKVTLITHTPLPERTVAAAARLCYSSVSASELMDGMTDEKASSFVQMLAGIGHDSPLEHAVFTFGIEGVSRALLAQITRHRIASFSVQSQRYIHGNHFDFVIPPEIDAIPEAREMFLQAMENDMTHYRWLTALLTEKHRARLVDEGMDGESAVKAAEKKAIEDARFVLPNACSVKMVITMNARSLLNLFKLRLCERAQWEIRALAEEMLRLCIEVAPELFSKAGPPCFSGACAEGRMSCGNAGQVREKYKKLHKNVRLKGDC